MLRLNLSSYGVMMPKPRKTLNGAAKAIVEKRKSILESGKPFPEIRSDLMWAMVAVDYALDNEEAIWAVAEKLYPMAWDKEFMKKLKKNRGIHYQDDLTEYRARAYERVYPFFDALYDYFIEED